MNRLHHRIDSDYGRADFELDFVNSKYSYVRYSVYGLMTLESHDLDFLPKQITVNELIEYEYDSSRSKNYADSLS